MNIEDASVTGSDSLPPPAATIVADTPEKTLLWHRIALAIIVIIAGFLDFYELNKVNYGNTYYAAAVKSMLTSWHNFFFVSFDAAGFVTVDKPPLALWIQAASAKLFGFSGFSLLLPEALAGVLSVILVYYLVRRIFGPVTGLIAALIMAITPVSVATNRDNIIDSVLVFALLLAAWAITRAVETGQLRRLLLCAVLLGLAFNIKTLEAYLVLPGFGLVYLLGAPISWRKRILHLVLAVAVLLIVSFSWIEAVDLTPASQRPYVGSSSDNSELGLTLGYNGLERVLGTAIGGNRGGNNAARQANETTDASSATGAPTTPEASSGQESSGSNTNSGGFGGGNRGGFGGGNRGGGGGGGFTSNGTSSASPFRLFAEDMAGQISWLLPLALIGIFVAGWQAWRMSRSRLPGTPRQHAIVLWGGWLLIVFAYFSISGAEHPYYLTTLAPGIATTAGIGIVALWKQFRRPGWLGWLLPITLVITALTQTYILSSYATYSSWMTPLILGLSLIAVIALIIARLRPRINTRFLANPALIVGVIALLLGPAVWSAVTTQTAGGLIPVAGPASVGNFAGFANGAGRPNNTDLLADRTGGTQQPGTTGTIGQTGAPSGFGGSTADSGLETYLLAHQGNAEYLVGMQSASSAATFILNSDKTVAVMAWGGFLGSDPILTTSQLATLVKEGKIRYFLTSGSGTTAGGIPTGASDINTVDLPAAILEQIESGEFSFGNGGGGGFRGSSSNNEISQWITKNCSAVASSEYETSSSSGSSTAGGFGGTQQLYDCAAKS
jgi:4-amino-4-deoxy-L-arabinose transferase-like glycosyltransferase